MSKAFGVYDTIDELSDALREVERLRAELAAAHQHLDEVYAAAGHSRISSEPVSVAVARLRAENERLRERLGRIAIEKA